MTDSASADKSQPENEQAGKSLCRRRALRRCANSAPAHGAGIEAVQRIPPPFFSQSQGLVVVRPLVARETGAEENVAWCTDRGWLNIAGINRKDEDAFKLKYNVATESSIACPAAYRPADPKVLGDSGIIFVACTTGFVHAVEEQRRGLALAVSHEQVCLERPRRHWQPPLCRHAQGRDVLFGREDRQTHLASADAVQFVSAGKFADSTWSIGLGRIAVINAKDGVRLDTIPTQQVPIKFANDETDRLYLADTRGLIQCLHEIDQTEPLVYRNFYTLAGEVQESPDVNEGIEEGNADEKTPADQERAAIRAKEASKGSVAGKKPSPSPSRPPKKEKPADKDAGQGNAESGESDNNPFK